MSVLTLAMCVRLSWLLVSFQVHIKSLHIIIIINIYVLGHRHKAAVVKINTERAT